jgi:hypothetical protein
MAVSPCFSRFVPCTVRYKNQALTLVLTDIVVDQGLPVSRARATDERLHFLYSRYQDEQGAAPANNTFE